MFGNFLKFRKKNNTKKINKSQHNKRNEQYEMVTWLISRYIAPSTFPFYEQFIIIVLRSSVYTCKGIMLMQS